MGRFNSRSISIRERKAHSHSRNAILSGWQQASSNRRGTAGRDTLKNLAVLEEARVGAGAVGEEARVDAVLVASDIEIIVAASAGAAGVPVGDVPVVVLWEAGGGVGLGDGDGQGAGGQGGDGGEGGDELHGWKCLCEVRLG